MSVFFEREPHVVQEEHVVAWEGPFVVLTRGLFSALDWGTIGGASSRTRTTGAGEAAKQTQVKSLVGRPGGKLHDMRVE